MRDIILECLVNGGTAVMTLGLDAYQKNLQGKVAQTDTICDDPKFFVMEGQKFPVLRAKCIVVTAQDAPTATPSDR